MIDIKFSSITIQSEDGYRAIVIAPRTYKGQSDFRVLQGTRQNNGDYFWNDIHYYHSTVEQAIKYHEYFLSPQEIPSAT